MAHPHLALSTSYLLNGHSAMALGAARKALGPKFRDPLSLSVHYPYKALEDRSCDLHVKGLGSGRTSTTCEVRARMAFSVNSIT